jgi:AhpD family alkylhydroperoxidase
MPAGRGFPARKNPVGDALVNNRQYLTPGKERERSALCRIKQLWKQEAAMAGKEREKRIHDLKEKMNQERGGSKAHWEYAAEKDVDFQEAYNNLYEMGLSAGKALPIKTRELIAIGILAFRGSGDGVYEHMKRALRHGATKEELLEAVETTIISGGAPTYGIGLKALMRIEEEEKKV